MPEKWSILVTTNGIHGTGLQVDENCSWNILVVPGLVVVNADSVQLEGTVALVIALLIDAVLLGDDLPELGANLVATLTRL